MSTRNLLIKPIRLITSVNLTSPVSGPSKCKLIASPGSLPETRQLGILSLVPLQRATGRVDGRHQDTAVSHNGPWMVSSARRQNEFHLETNSEAGLGSHDVKSENGYLMTLLFTTTAVLLALFNWENLKKSVVVQAAKPFNDSRYETNDCGRDGGINKLSSSASDGGSSKRRQEFNFVADVVEAVGTSVVCIEMKDNTMVDWITGKPELMSNGSGFIISEDGLILTNAHVVVGRNKLSLTVKLHDGRTFPAHIEDVDLNSDLAIIRIKSRGLPTMPLGSSSKTRIGEWVVALGSPLSLTNTVTAGVVSSVCRKANELGINVNDISYIQTDAAITFGNSGGPLVNLDGEAIGINSMKVAAGISFAIPIDYVKLYLADADKRRVAGSRKPRRRYMGATLLTLTDDLVRELHASNTILPQISRGVLVWKVVVGSPAYKCGLKPGDIIYRVNGMDITSATPIFDLLQTSESLNFHVIRRDAAVPSFACVMYPEEVPEEN